MKATTMTMIERPRG